MSARFIIGDSLTVLRSMPDASVDLVLTSPPFLALRSYLPADHPQKALEMGSEPTPGAFIDALLTLTEECRRVLTPHGSLCVELGDTYSGSGGAGGDYGDQGLRDGQPKFEGSGRRNRPADVAAGILAPTKRPGPQGRDAIPGWPLDKSLCLIPELYRVALVYGFNPLTGRETPRGTKDGGRRTRLRRAPRPWPSLNRQDREERPMDECSNGAQRLHNDAVPPLTAAAAMAVLRGERTVRGVAAACGVAQETAHRHLRAARELGLVGWEPDTRGTLHARVRVVGGAG